MKISYMYIAYTYIVIILLLEQVVRVEAEKTSVYVDSPSQATASPVNTQQLLQVGLSAANYKTRMRTLMNLEMKQIEQRLSTDVEQ